MRVPDGAVQFQQVDEAVLQDRDTRLAEEFANRVGTGRRLARVEAGDVARGKVGVGVDPAGLTPPLGTEGEADAAGAEVEQIAVSEGKAGDLRVIFFQVGRADAQVIARRRAEIVEAEDIGRHAARIPRRGRAASDGVARQRGRRGRARRRIQEDVVAGRREEMIDGDVAELALRILGARVHVVAVVVEPGDGIALHAGDHAIGVAVVEVGARPDLGRAIVEARRADITVGVGVEPTQSGLERGRIEGRIDQQVDAADHAAAERRAVADRSRGQLGIYPVVDELAFEIGPEMLADLILAHGRDEEALHRHLEIVHRVEVVRERGRVAGGVAVAGEGDDVVGAATGACAQAGNIDAPLRDRTRTRVEGRRAVLVVALREGREGALAGEGRLALGIAAEDRDVAAVVGEVRAERQADVEDLPVALLRDVVLAVELDAREAALEDEVDDARDGVGTVHRRLAAGDDVDALDERRGNGVQIHRLGDVERDVAAAVDHHQGALRAEAAQVDGGNAAARVVRGRAGRRGDLRQVVEDVLDVGRGGLQLDVVLADDRDRAGALEVGARDARTGDDDFLVRLRGGGGGHVGRGGGRRGLGEQRAGEAHGADQDGRSQQLPANLRNHF